MSLSLLLVVGESAILQAGPCQDCETTKTIELGNCDIDWELNDKNCVADAKGGVTKCENVKEGSIAKAKVDRESGTYVAHGTFSVASAACLAAKSPACLGTVTAAYVALLGKIYREYEANVAKAGIDAATCEKNWRVDCGTCRAKADNTLKACQQKADKKYAACKKNCGGNDGGG